MNSPRTVESCRYRTRVRPHPEHGEVACCGLLGELSGVEDASLLDASRGACEACVTKFAPSPTDINPVIASLLFGVAREVTNRGGVAGCDLAKADQLRLLSKDNLEVIMTTRSGGTAADNPKVASCFYRGEQTGERDCHGCNGTVRSKVFACHHERHTETTILECRKCRDHEPALTPSSVSNWAVGVTVAPRQNPRIEESLRSLASAGWQTPRVFAEPETELPSWLDPSLVTVRNRKLGPWPNWLLALSELVLTEPYADAYLMCQDDVLYCNGLRTYLEETLWPAGRLGVVSLYCAGHQDRGDIEGYYPISVGWGAWGAQAYVLSNASARALLRNQEVINHRSKGPSDGLRNVDSVVGQWCLESELDYYLHTPSLTQHVGDTSTIWEGSKTTGRRRAATFVGEDADIREVVTGADDELPIASASPPPS